MSTQYDEIFAFIKSYIEFAERSFYPGEVQNSKEHYKKEKILQDTAYKLNYLRKRVEECKNCSLFKTRRQIVFGDGNINSKLVFVGEAPGEEEDIQGLPFVGRAGKLLTDIIHAMGLRRDDVYICNAVKCRPPGNRTPSEDEIMKCNPFLIEQIELIKPEMIVALGAVSVRALFKTRESIFSLRGKFLDFKGIKVMPTFHPGFLLRNPEYKKYTWKDIQLVMKEMNIPIPVKKGGSR